MDERRLMREVNRAFARSTRNHHPPLYPPLVPPHASLGAAQLISAIALITVAMGVWWVLG